MGRTRTSFNSLTASKAGKVGGKTLLKMKGVEYFRKIAKKSWKSRKASKT